jgi:hypothetical protein
MSVGGLIGAVEYAGYISNCYNSGAVTGQWWRIGGLIGENQYGWISNCYSVGTVSAVKGNNIGGLLGFNWSPDRVTSCFWDVEASGQTESAGGAGLTAAEMMTAATFLEAGWDFIDETENGTDDIWWIPDSQDYPRLWWQLEDEGDDQ